MCKNLQKYFLECRQDAWSLKNYYPPHNIQPHEKKKVFKKVFAKWVNIKVFLGNTLNLDKKYGNF